MNYNHESTNIFEACGTDKETVVQAHSYLMMRIMSQAKTSQFAELIEEIVTTGPEDLKAATLLILTRCFVDATTKYIRDSKEAEEEFKHSPIGFTC